MFLKNISSPIYFSELLTSLIYLPLMWHHVSETTIKIVQGTKTNGLKLKGSNNLQKLKGIERTFSHAFSSQIVCLVLYIGYLGSTNATFRGLVVRIH